MENIDVNQAWLLPLRSLQTSRGADRPKCTSHDYKVPKEKIRIKFLEPFE